MFTPGQLWEGLRKCQARTRERVHRLQVSPFFPLNPLQEHPLTTTWPNQVLN